MTIGKNKHAEIAKEAGKWGPEGEWRTEEKQQGKVKAWSKSIPDTFTKQQGTKEIGEKSDRRVVGNTTRD